MPDKASRNTCRQLRLYKPHRCRGFTEFSEDDVVYTLVRDQAEENQAAAAFASHGVNMVNVHFIRAVTDAPYTRDHGPWHIVTS